jgi:3-hydroxyacyl-CoA dehydrogenase
LSSWRSKRVLAGVAATLALAVGGGVGFAATRSGSDPAASESPAAFLADVAERLGIESEKLEAAIEAEALERLDAAVAAGRVTEEEAAKIRERIESGDVPFLGRHHRHAPVLNGAAEYIGVTPAKLREELKGGKTLAEAAEAHGKTAEGLVEALLADAKEHLDQAVADGKLTQAQEDGMLERLRETLPNAVQRDFHLPPPGFPPPGTPDAS